jgi:hypothetical protein
VAVRKALDQQQHEVQRVVILFDLRRLDAAYPQAKPDIFPRLVCRSFRLGRPDGAGALPLLATSWLALRNGSVRAPGMGHNFARNPMTCCSKGTSEVQFAFLPQPVSTRKDRTHTSPSYLPALTGATATHFRSLHHIKPPSCIYFHRIHKTHFKTRSPDRYHVEDIKQITY